MTTPSTTAEHRVIYHTVVGRHVRGALRCRPDHLVRRPGDRSPAPRVPRGVVRGLPLGHHRPARAPLPVPPLARTGHGRGGDARGRGGGRRAAPPLPPRATPGARVLAAPHAPRHPDRAG